MMNQENMWFYIYVYPPYGCQSYLEFNGEPVLPVQKVEEQKGFEIIQEYTHNNQSNLSKGVKSSRKNNDGQLKNQEDSSFSLPAKQYIKTGQQKLGRNSISNILRMFTKMLKTRLFQQKFENLKLKFNLPTSYKQFTSWTTGIGLNINKYIRIKKVLNGIISKPQFGKFLAILYEIFQAQYARPAILTSSKTETKNIHPTLFQIRNIKEEIKNAVIIGFETTSKDSKKIL